MTRSAQAEVRTRRVIVVRMRQISPTRLFTLALATTVSGCAPPPPELTASQEEMVRQCLELAYEQETSSECAQRVTKPMEKAFLRNHPDFHDRLLADRKAFVEERIAEDQRKRDKLNLCLDDHEVGKTDSTACETFMKHEIARGIEDRRLRRCAEARLDGSADAERQCEGLPDHIIDEEVQAERVRRERRQ
jgi:hypothetical protein